MVELFMKYEPNIHNVNNAGITPLEFAERRNDTKLIEILTRS
jgi:ankyrin repeat protein